MKTGSGLLLIVIPLLTLPMLSITGCNYAYDMSGTSGSSEVGSALIDVVVTTKARIPLLHNDAGHDDIDIHTENGFVRLTGILDDQNQIERASTATLPSPASATCC
jgi:osmotically-inducible protein OsmY